MNIIIKRTLIVAIAVIVALILIVGGYVVYVVAHYDRLGQIELDVIGANPATALQADQEYQALTWNIGFGAYSQDYSFFMDESTLRRDVEDVGNTGDTVSGSASTAKSEESTLRTTNGVIKSVEGSLISIGAFRQVMFP